MSPARARESAPSTITPTDKSRLINIKEETDWHTFFSFNGPLDIDVGCGKGRFLLARATLYPERLIMGIERQLIRLRKIDRRLHNLACNNARLVQGDAAALLDLNCATGSIDNLFVLFPDPWPKRRHHKRRLMSRSFASTAKRVLKTGGCVHFATDHNDYFKDALPFFDNHSGFRRIKHFIPSPEEQTDFELIFSGKGQSISRASWQLA